MKHVCYPPRRNTEYGSTMLEVLITLVVVMLGLLGLIGLQSKAQQAELESYQRTQALILLQDMVESIKANRKAAPCFAITTSSGTPYLGTNASSSITCSTTGTSADNVASESIAQWSALLKGAAEWQGTKTTNNSNVGAMIGARGCIARDAASGSTPETYSVAIAWQGLSDTVAAALPSSSPAGLQNVVSCGKGEFGAEARRRVAWTTFSFANQN